MLRIVIYVVTSSLIINESWGQFNPSFDLSDPGFNLTSFFRGVIKKDSARKREVTDIPVNLFQPVHAETETPLTIASIPTIKLQEQPNIVFNQNSFNEQSSASGKDLNDDSDIKDIDRDLDQNKGNEEKKNVRNFEYTIDPNSPNVTIPRDLENALRGISLSGDRSSFLDFLQDRIQQNQGKGKITVHVRQDKQNLNKTLPADRKSFFDNDNVFENIHKIFPLSLSSEPLHQDIDEFLKTDQFDPGTEQFTHNENEDSTNDNIQSTVTANVATTEAPDSTTPEAFVYTSSYRPYQSRTTPGNTLGHRSNRPRSRPQLDYIYYDEESEEVQPPRRVYSARRIPATRFEDSEEDQELVYQRRGQRTHRVPFKRRPTSRRVFTDDVYQDEDDYRYSTNTRRRPSQGTRRQIRPVLVDYYDENSEEQGKEVFSRHRPVSSKTRSNRFREYDRSLPTDENYAVHQNSKLDFSPGQSYPPTSGRPLDPRPFRQPIKVASSSSD